MVENGFRKKLRKSLKSEKPRKVLSISQEMKENKFRVQKVKWFEPRQRRKSRSGGQEGGKKFLNHARTWLSMPRSEKKLFLRPTCLETKFLAPKGYPRPKFAKSNFPEPSLGVGKCSLG